jgi:hypothetical protein
MDRLDRVTYAFGHVSGHSVAIFKRGDWYRLIRPTGEPTRLTDIPSPLGAVPSRVAVVAVAGSGMINPSPGIDIVRFDAKDARMFITLTTTLWLKIFHCTHNIVAYCLLRVSKRTRLLAMHSKSTFSLLVLRNLTITG